MRSENVSKTHNEETDYIVDMQFFLGYLYVLGAPAMITFGLNWVEQKGYGFENAYTNTYSELLISWMQRLQNFQLFSAYYYAFVSMVNAPFWWPSFFPGFIHVGPKIHFVFYVVLNTFLIPGTVCCIVFAFHR
jgi:hypothetical protein